MSLSKGRFAIHLLLVVAFLALPYIFAPKGIVHIKEILYNPHERTNLLAYILMLIFFYLNYYLLIPVLYFSRKFLAYTLSVCLCFSLVISMVILSDRHDILPWRSNPPSIKKESRLEMPFPSHNLAQKHPQPNSAQKPPFGFELSHALFLFLVGVFVSLSLRINERLQHAEREKINSELAFLKAQINPHFLFNTLNSIYALAIEQSPHTADAVVKLSSLMRYVMREADTNLVLLSKEINYIENYVALQKLRLDDTVDIHFSVRGYANGLQIAPLLLISFIENTFKYGVNPQEKSAIEIHIEVEQGHLHLHTFNKKVRAFHDEEASSGLGLENTKTRLALLYPTLHTLVIEETEMDFRLVLHLYLIS